MGDPGSDPVGRFIEEWCARPFPSLPEASEQEGRARLKAAADLLDHALEGRCDPLRAIRAVRVLLERAEGYFMIPPADAAAV